MTDLTKLVVSVLGHKGLGRDARGQTLVEYTLILFLVSIVGIALLKVIGVTVRDFLDGVAEAI